MDLIIPVSAHDHVVRGKNRWALGQPEGAIADLRVALALEPGHVQAALLLGELLAQLGRSSEAADCISHALAACPEAEGVDERGFPLPTPDLQRLLGFRASLLRRQGALQQAEFDEARVRALQHAGGRS